MIWGYHYLWKHPYDSKPCQTSSLPRFRSSWCEDRCGWPSVRRAPNWNVNINGLVTHGLSQRLHLPTQTMYYSEKNPQNDHRCLSFDPPNMSNFFMTRFHGSYEFDCLQCFVGGSFCWVLGFSRRIKCRFVQTSVQISNLSASKLKKVTRHAFICGV